MMRQFLTEGAPAPEGEPVPGDAPSEGAPAKGDEELVDAEGQGGDGDAPSSKSNVSVAEGGKSNERGAERR